MEPTDLVMIDMDPQDPFDFYLEHYVEQLDTPVTFSPSAHRGVNYRATLRRLVKSMSKS